jgi:hypothetical protein
VFQVDTITDGNGTVVRQIAARKVPKMALKPDFTSLLHGSFYSKGVTAETFKEEMALAMKAYDSYVINIDKIPEEFEASLKSLMAKAIRAYETRGPQLRHGIALDKHVTVILSQSDNERPLCGIYFNLHSPYQKQSLPKTVRALEETIGETRKAKED